MYLTLKDKFVFQSLYSKFENILYEKTKERRLLQQHQQVLALDSY